MADVVFNTARSNVLGHLGAAKSRLSRAVFIYFCPLSIGIY